MTRGKSEEFRKAAPRWQWEGGGREGRRERFGLGRKHIFRCMLFPAGGRKLSSLQELGREVNKEGWGLGLP